MFWSCPSLLNYWRIIFQTLSKILNRNVNLDPLTAVFSVIDREFPTYSLVTPDYRNRIWTDPPFYFILFIYLFNIIIYFN